MRDSFRVVIHRRHARAQHWQQPLYEGFRRHGIEPQFVPGNVAQDCDLAVTWSINDRAAQARIAAGLPVLIMEHGFLLGNERFCRLGYDGVGGRADYLNRHVPGDRWARHFAHLMKPWRDSEDGAILIGAQVRGDQTHGIDIAAWCHEMSATLARHFPDRARAFRHHPADPIPAPEGCRLANGDLANELRKIWLVVTFNTSLGIDAALAGVPVVAFHDSSMAWPVAAHDLESAPLRPDRTPWVHGLAYCEWTAAEMAEGEAWEHLKGKFD